MSISGLECVGGDFLTFGCLPLAGVSSMLGVRDLLVYTSDTPVAVSRQHSWKDAGINLLHSLELESHSQSSYVTSS